MIQVLFTKVSISKSCSEQLWFTDSDSAQLLFLTFVEIILSLYPSEQSDYLRV